MTPAGVWPPCRSRAGLAFEGVVDRLDDLAQGLEEPGPGPGGLALAGGAQQAEAALGQGGLELAAVVVLVRDDDLPGPAGAQGRVVQDGKQHLPLVSPWRRSARSRRAAPARWPAGAAAAPRNTGNDWRSTHTRPSSQVRAAGGLPGAAAFHRRGISNPHVIGPQAGIPGQHADQPGHRGRQGTQPLVVPRLLRQAREHAPQMHPGIPQPASLRGEPQQRLHDRHGDQLRVTDLRADAGHRAAGRPMRRFLQQVISSHIQCGREGVQVCLHKLILDALAPSPQTPLGIGRLAGV